MGNPYHDQLGKFTTGPHSGVKNALGLAVSKSFKGGGAASEAHGGAFGKVKERLPNGIEVAPIYARNKDGSIRMTKPVQNKKTGKWSEPKPQLDAVATWRSVPDSVLDENLRQAIRQSKPWAVEAGKEWYPGVRRRVDMMRDQYSDKFKEQHGIELSPPVAAGLIASYSRNSGWVRNIVGVRQFLDDPHARNPKSGATDMHITMPGGANDLIKFVKKRHAAGKTDDDQNVGDFFKSFPGAPKPMNFYHSIMGREENGTVDRWMTRIMLHTDDTDFAQKMVSASATRTLKNADGSKRKVEVNYGFSRMRSSMLRVAREPEFKGLSPIQLQAIPWVHVVGPEGAVGYVSDLSSDAAATAEMLGVSTRRHWGG